MDMTEIEKLVQNKINMIDTFAPGETSTKFHNEIYGIKQTLRCLGYKLEVSLNPFVSENKKSSTFTITQL
jgi:hypothetical protein